jgi:hypothetical protein
VTGYFSCRSISAICARTSSGTFAAIHALSTTKPAPGAAVMEFAETLFVSVFPDLVAVDRFASARFVLADLAVGFFVGMART